MKKSITVRSLVVLGLAGAATVGVAAAVQESTGGSAPAAQSGHVEAVETAATGQPPARITVDGEQVPVKEEGTTRHNTEAGSSVTVTTHNGQQNPGEEPDEEDGDGVVVDLDQTISTSAEGDSRVRSSSTVRQSSRSSSSTKTTQSESTSVKVSN
jgi:hypothetical protein